MWNQYPKHLMEPKVVVPSVEWVPEPDREINPKRRRPHRYT